MFRDGGGKSCFSKSNVPNSFDSVAEKQWRKKGKNKPCASKMVAGTRRDRFYYRLPNRCRFLIVLSILCVLYPNIFLKSFVFLQLLLLVLCVYKYRYTIRLCLVFLSRIQSVTGIKSFIISLLSPYILKSHTQVHKIHTCTVKNIHVSTPKSPSTPALCSLHICIKYV